MHPDPLVCQSHEIFHRGSAEGSSLGPVDDISPDHPAICIHQIPISVGAVVKLFLEDGEAPLGRPPGLAPRCDRRFQDDIVAGEEVEALAGERDQHLKGFFRIFARKAFLVNHSIPLLPVHLELFFPGSSFR